MPSLFQSFVWKGTTVLYQPCSRDQTTGDLKSHYLQADVTALSVSPPHLFFQQYMKQKSFFFKGTHGLFGGHVPLRPPLWVRHCLMPQSTIFQSCRDGATASWVLPVLFGEIGYVEMNIHYLSLLRYAHANFKSLKV